MENLAYDLVADGLVDRDYFAQHLIATDRQDEEVGIDPSSYMPARQVSAPAEYREVYQQEHNAVMSEQHCKGLRGSPSMPSNRTRDNKLHADELRHHNSLLDEELKNQHSQHVHQSTRTHTLPPLPSTPSGSLQRQQQRPFRSAPGRCIQSTAPKVGKLPLRRSHSAMSADHRPYALVPADGSATKVVRRHSPRGLYHCENRQVNVNVVSRNSDVMNSAPHGTAIRLNPTHLPSHPNILHGKSFQQSSAMFVQKAHQSFMHEDPHQRTSHKPIDTHSMQLDRQHYNNPTRMPEICMGKSKQSPQEANEQEKTARLMRTITGNNASFKGVSRQKWMARWEAHVTLSDNQKVFLGGFDSKEKAARVHDLATIKLLGRNVPDSQLNFPVTSYEGLLMEFAFVESMSSDEFVQRIRKQSAGYREKCSRRLGALLW